MKKGGREWKKRVLRVDGEEGVKGKERKQAFFKAV